MIPDLVMAKQWMRQKDWHTWVDSEGNTMWMKSIGRWECWKLWLSRPHAQHGLTLFNHRGRHVLDDLFEHGGRGWSKEEWALKSVQTWLNQSRRMELSLFQRLQQGVVHKMGFCDSLLLKNQLLPFLAYPASSEEAENGLKHFYGPAMISWMGRYHWEVKRLDVRWKVAWWNVVMGEEAFSYYHRRWLDHAVLSSEEKKEIQLSRPHIEKIKHKEARQYFFEFFLSQSFKDSSQEAPKKRL